MLTNNHEKLVVYIHKVWCHLLRKHRSHPWRWLLYYSILSHVLSSDIDRKTIPITPSKPIVMITFATVIKVKEILYHLLGWFMLLFLINLYIISLKENTLFGAWRRNLRGSIINIHYSFAVLLQDNPRIYPSIIVSL